MSPATASGNLRAAMNSLSGGAVNMRRIVVLAAACTVFTCARSHIAPGVQVTGAELRSVSWSDLDGWVQDDHAVAYSTFASSCRAVTEGALHPICRRALARGPLAGEDARLFFEDNFVPARIAAVGEEDGLITAYYVPVFPASRTRSERYSAALYAKPANADDLKLTRADIEAGALSGKGLELFWADPIDAFFAQIQGSARLRLEDGTVHKLEYAAKTDHPYTSVGRVLIDRGIIPAEEMSMQAIRAWMAANPEPAVEVRQQNKPFVFFAASPAVGDEQGHGAQGFTLVPRRSIAVDHKLHPYGTLMFISADLPIEGAEPTTPFRHLMVAMDTGSAIIGPARADIYWGVGDAAAEVAGRFKHRGTFVMLVPR